MDEIGPYELIEKLGSGGMGTVYRARHTATGQIVALKLMRADLGGDPVFVRRFEREAGIAQSLTSPHIVATLDAGVEDATPYIAMELVEGESLSTYLRRAGPLLVDEALEIGAQIAQGLDVAHQQGVIHRDISPQNILITKEGVAKIADFGIARSQAYATLTATAAFIGKPAYTSPEMLVSGQADIRGDIYALGVILFEMLTGRPVFLAPTPMAVMDMHVRQPPPKLEHLGVRVPPSVEAVLDRCLEKDPNRRFQTPQDLIHALEGRAPWIASRQETADAGTVTLQSGGAGGLPPMARRGFGGYWRWIAGIVAAMSVIVLVPTLILTAPWKADESSTAATATTMRTDSPTPTRTSGVTVTPTGNGQPQPPGESSVLNAMLAGSVGGGRFEPSFGLGIVGGASPGEHSDFDLSLDMSAGQVNFSLLVFYLPRSWGVTPGTGIEVGTKVGNVRLHRATLGLINAACNTSLEVEFELLNSSLDTAKTVSFKDLERDSPSANGYGTRDFAEDKDNNGLVDAVDHYPDFLNRVLPGLQPLRRSAGVTPIAGTPTLLQFLIFEPGTRMSSAIPSDPGLGYPVLTLFQDFGDSEAEPQPGPITDFCTPFGGTIFNLGIGENFVAPGINEDGPALFTNPSAGRHAFTLVAFGQRDADGDGMQNSMDTCPYALNAGDATVTGGGDADNDGLDAACDPSDAVVNSDEDQDGYLNRQDNCPLDANGENADNQRDTDFDQIGDACDSSPDSPDGDIPKTTREVGATIS